MSVTGTTSSRGARSWALPPQPPETWVGGLWSTLLLGAVLVVVAVQLQPLHTGASASQTALASCRAIAGAAAALAAFVLPVEAMVTGDRWLRWTAGGFGAAYLLLVAHPLAKTGRPDEVLAAVVLAAVAVAALTAHAERPDGLRLLLPVAAAAAAAVAAAVLPDRALWAVTALLALAAGLRWLRSGGPGHRRWLVAGFALAAVAAALRAVAQTATDPWWAGVVAATGALALPAAGIGVTTAAGFGRQSRRWRRLEAEIKALRRGTRLLPNRSVTPEDEDGLPSAEDVLQLIAQGRVRMALQPVVDLATGATVGGEALSRFGGGTPTDRWFKAASLYGLAAELEQLTLRAALSLLAELPADQFLAVNVSPVALAHDPVLALLHDVDLSRVVVEITEHDAVADYAVAREVLRRLRSLGARIAVDDTGAGFASLRHVLLLQPEVIKLDISLTRHVDVDRRQQALVRAVTAFSAQVGATVLAEGVETQEQLVALREIGVQLGQGWHLGVPVLMT